MLRLSNLFLLLLITLGSVSCSRNQQPPSRGAEPAGAVQSEEDGAVTDDRRRAELDELLNTLLPMAEQHLANYGEFFPFAAAIGSDGKSRLVNTYWGDEHPSSNEVIAQLTSILREGAAKGEYQAVGICFNGTLRDESGENPEDAVIVWLDLRQGQSAQVAMPYSRNHDGSYEFGKLIAMRNEPFAFQDE